MKTQNKKKMSKKITAPTTTDKDQDVTGLK
jgi:hypothetical protein